MSEMPTLGDILDSYLNTGDYDDALDGWVSVSFGMPDRFLITFTRGEGEEMEGTTYVLMKVDE